MSDPIVTEQHHPKVELYKKIHGQENITNALKNWLKNICLMIQTYHKSVYEIDVDNNTLPLYFQTSNPENDKKTMSGYIDVNIKNITDIVNGGNDSINQRIILTTIYRFLLHFSRFIWTAILKCQVIYPNSVTVDNVHALLGNTVDIHELRQHMKFVLQRHGVYDPKKDVAQQLYDVFLEPHDKSGIDKQHVLYDFFSKNPRFMISLTSPIGTHVTFDWMNIHVGDVAVRMQKSTRPAHGITPDFLQYIGSPLCSYEQHVESQPVSWVTGAQLYGVNPNSYFASVARKYNKWVRTGPSGTTHMMLDGALLFGIDVHDVLLACVPWMEIAKDHSIFEILLAANSYLPYDEYVLENSGTPTTSGTPKSDDIEVQFIHNLYTKRHGSQLQHQSGGMEYNDDSWLSKLHDYDTIDEQSTEQSIQSTISTSECLIVDARPQIEFTKEQEQNKIQLSSFSSVIGFDANNVFNFIPDSTTQISLESLPEPNLDVITIQPNVIDKHRQQQASVYPIYKDVNQASLSISKIRLASAPLSINMDSSTGKTRPSTARPSRAAEAAGGGTEQSILHANYKKKSQKTPRIIYKRK